jgi:16S rRNA (cytidine1402-2'-O)-methyltransferase
VTEPGRLTLVATPIGNLDDLSPRAQQVLAEVDVIACEDTRHTGRLLSHFGIKPQKLLNVRDANERGRAAEIVTLLQSGKNVALVTDAGTPAISDPGYRVVAAVTGARLDVSTVPGPSAVIAALSISGLPTARFVMEGFLPRKGTDRASRLAAIAVEPRTIVIYEAPHRLLATLRDLAETCDGDRVIAIVREITKLHEQVWRGQLKNATASPWEPRGEYVLVLGGALPTGAPDDELIAAALAGLMAQGVDRKTAVVDVAADLGVPRRRVYELSVVRRGAPNSDEHDEQT